MDDRAGSVGTSATAETYAELRARLDAERVSTYREPTEAVARSTSQTLRRWLRRLPVLAGAAVVLFFVLTAFTGLPGPDAIRRYPLADLERVADQINRQERDHAYSRLDDPEPASVDWLRGRIATTNNLIPCSVWLEDESDWDLLLADYDANTCPSVPAGAI